MWLWKKKLSAATGKSYFLFQGKSIQNPHLYLTFFIISLLRILDVVTDTSLSAPDMVALLKHTDTFTNLDVNIMQGFLNASTWNASTMSFSKNDTMKDLVGGSRVTLIVPLDEYLNSALNALAIRRLRSPVWSRHLHDMLGHMMLPRIYTQEEIRTEAGVAGGFGQTETVAGTFISTETSSGTSIGGGVLQDPSMNAIDG